ncbi:MAG: acyl-CoA dehydrogenase family protein [Deltaproteobacteria bacterium]|nr:acyl-CoA dehydrogenase family protein [Deltaproteobacteria bacterium]
MTALLNGKLILLRDRMARFAAHTVAPRTDLHTMEEFPRDLWEEFAREGLFGLALPRSCGGSGGAFLDLAVAGDALVHHGHNPGIALTWLMHEMTSRIFIAGSGTTAQKALYLPRMARGEITASLAVSEPQTGAHPKHLKTWAEKRGSSYIINGEKAYLTNGPIADLFIVVAVTDIIGERKEFTSFLVPADTPGLSRTVPLKLSILRPSPHGGILLVDCEVPATAILGKKGRAYEDASVRFRTFEDVLGMAPGVGGMSRQLELAAAMIGSKTPSPDDATAMALGTLRMLKDTMRILAYTGATMLGARTTPQEAVSLAVTFRRLAGEFQETLARTLAAHSLTAEGELALLTADLTGMLSIAKNVAALRQKKLGASLIPGVH